MTLSMLTLEGNMKRKVNFSTSCRPVRSLKLCSCREAIVTVALKEKLGKKTHLEERDLRQSGSRDDKLWWRGAGLCLDCSGTGTRLRADAIVVIQPASEPSQSHGTHLAALGEMKWRNVSPSTKLQCCLEHKRASHGNSEINNHDADDRPDNKYL